MTSTSSSSERLMRSVIDAAATAPQESLTADERAGLLRAVRAAGTARGVRPESAESRPRRERAIGRRSASSPSSPDIDPGGRGRLVYLAGLVATLLVCIALTVAVMLAGSSEPASGTDGWRQADGGLSASDSTIAVTRANSGATSSNGAGSGHANRNVGRQPGDPGLADRLRAARERLQTGRQGWNVRDVQLTVGEPEAVADAYLRDLQDEQRVDQWENVGRREEVPNPDDRQITLFYTVVPYDLMRGAPHVAPRELFRFEFASTRDRHVEWCREVLAELPDTPETRGTRESVSQLLAQLTASESVYQLMRLERVEPDDADYRIYMPR